MINAWIRSRLERARWSRFALWFALLMGFSFWAFMGDSPWTRAQKAGGGKLPEVQPGFPTSEPERSIAALREAGGVNDYLIWQILDFPYAVMNVMVMSTALALGIVALRAEKTLLRFLLLLPPAYFACELIENALVAAFAANLAPLAGPAVLIQQVATTGKFAVSQPALLLGLVGLLIAAGVGAARLMRRK